MKANSPGAIRWRRILFMSIGVILFAGLYFSPPWPDAVDPTGANFAPSREGKGALAVFLLAGIWSVFGAVPNGI